MKVIIIKSKYFILVLVLISIISISAVSAVDDVDIGTDVLETTDDLSVDTVSLDESVDLSSPVEESVDLSADDVSVDDDLGESRIIDENIDLSVEDDLDEISFNINGNSNDLNENLRESYDVVTSSNLSNYFNNDGTLKTNNNLKFEGFFWGSAITTLVIDRNISINTTDALFENMGFNLKASNVSIENCTFVFDWGMHTLDSVIRINADNVSVVNVTFYTFENVFGDFITIDVNNSNFSSIINNSFVYYVNGQCAQNYNYVIKLNLSNYSVIRNNNFDAFIPLKSVNFNVSTFPSIETDLAAVIAVQESNYLQLLNNTINLEASSSSSSIPTLDTIIIVKSNNSLISNNIISERDFNNSNSNYLYGIDLYELSNVTISNNNVSISTIGGVITPKGAGAAYPIQITGPVSDIFIHDNNLTTINNGPNCGIYSQNYYGPTYLNISNNFINVTGRATNDYYSLVSGMELQDTSVTIFNNTIYAQNLNNYSSSNNIYGVSYYQTTPNGHTFDISENTIRTNGHYAVYLASSQGSIVYHNFLKTYDLCCNNAVHANAFILDNYCSCTNCNCTSNNICSNSNNVNSMISSESKKINSEILMLTAIDDEILTDEEPQTIDVYIGQNIDEGNGTEENPYANLTVAWNKILELPISSPTNIVLNFKEGDYIFDSNFGSALQVSEFMNITLQGVPEKEVNFLFYMTDIFNLNNLIGIKYSNLNFIFFNGNGLSNSFTVDKNFNVIIENCKFINGTRPLVFTAPESGEYVRIMKNCSFFNYNNIALITFSAMRKNTASSIINYCTFYNCTGMNGQGNQKVWISASVMMATLADIDANYIWWGSNSPQVKNYTNSAGNEVNIFTGSDKINNTIYAIYNTTFNAIGNNQFEVIGKLTWNDGTTDGIEYLYDMPVSLVSTTGTFNESNPVLKDGIFTVIYTSDSSTNEITATLDREVQTLTFNTIELPISVEDINYGEYANVSVTIPAGINAIVNVTVNNQTYSVNADSNVIVPINELLSCGIYTVDVILVDAENNVYGSNSTTFEVKKIEPKDIDTILNITSPTDGTSASFSIDLPNATGNLTVTVNNKNYTKELVNGKATVEITDLPAGTYNAVITYSGDDNFAPISKNATITIKSATPSKVATKLSAAKVTATYNVAKKLVITLKDANGKALAGKKLTVKVGSISKTLKTNAKGQVSLNIAKLVPKTYNAVIKFAGDSAYSASSVKAKVVVKKAKVKLAAKAKTFKAKVKTKKYTVTLKNNKGKVLKKVKLTLKVGKKTYKATTNSKGKATFKITKLTKKGKKTATVKFAGSKYYKALSKKVKITIK